MDAVGKIIAATSLATIILIAGAAFIEPNSQPAPLLARGWLYGTLFLIGTRLLLNWAESRARAAGVVATPTLIVGAGGSAPRRAAATTQPELGCCRSGTWTPIRRPRSWSRAHRAGAGHPRRPGASRDRTGARHVVFGFLSARTAGLP